MTPEEREALVKARLFFFRSGTLASALFGKGKRDLDDEMTTLYEQMLDFVGGNSESLNAMFARFGNTLKSSYALSKCLDNDGSLPQSNCQELYQSLETIFAEGFDLSTNQRGIGSFVDNRWQQFLERHKQVPGIKDLSGFRKGQQVSTYAASHGLALVDNAPMQTKKKKVVW